MTRRTERVGNRQKIRLGKIAYTNVWPVFYNFPPQKLKDRMELVVQTPTELNRALTSGSIDAAAISSFAYAKKAEDLILLPDLSVSAQGAVGSIFLFTKSPLGERLPECIAMATTSATSVHLLKMIMAKRFEHTPAYTDMAPNLEAMMQVCDAALLIGDDAIRASWSIAGQGYFVYDVGKLWKEWTGFGMTFAVWAVREAWAVDHSEDVAALHEAFVASKQEGVRLPERLLNEAVRTIGGTAAYWHAYFSGLTYDFGAEQRQGLELYFQFAYDLGFLERVPPVKLWRNPNLMRVNE